MISDNWLLSWRFMGSGSIIRIVFFAGSFVGSFAGSFAGSFVGSFVGYKHSSIRNCFLFKIRHHRIRKVLLLRFKERQ